MSKKVPFILKVFRVYFNSVAHLYPSVSAKQLISLFSKPRVRVLRAREVEVLDKAENSFLKFGKEEIKVYQWGEGEKLAMLFHGWESNAGSLGAFIDPLLEKGYRIIAFDAPAHGGSKGKYSNLVYFKKTAKEMMHKYGVPNVAIGHSLGACAIIMCAYEDNLHFERTILLAPLNRLMSVFEEYQKILKIPKKLFQSFLSHFEDFAGYSFQSFYFHNYGKQTNLDRVLLFHDEEDKITNFSHASDFEQNWDAIRLEPIRETGHYRVLWDAGMITKAMDYIRN
ncbi:MAG: alpha-beta hydrolase superfamily lysophospholipase [Vicingaceae bacterium]|jgi:alpha-beta hydrolase superfamily lysophospholipase